MSTNERKDKMLDAAGTAAAVVAVYELVDAARIGVNWFLQEDNAVEFKEYMHNNFETLRTNFTK